MSKLKIRWCILCLRWLILSGVMLVTLMEFFRFLREKESEYIRISYRRHDIWRNETEIMSKKSKLVDDHFRESEVIFKEMMNNYYVDYDEYYRPMLTRAFDYRRFTKDIFVQNIEPNCSVRPYLLIQIHSAAININKRLAIRHSWGRYVPGQSVNGSVGGRVLTTFVVGRSSVNSINLVIQREGEQYNDILFNNALDSYKTLTNKTISGLRWVAEKCTPRYVLKTDDDCYVNIPNVLKYLKSQTMENLYTGRIFAYRVVDRDESSEYFTEGSVYNKKYFPPYISGGGYILSGHLIPRILKHSEFHAMVPKEDAYIGILMDSIGVPPKENMKILPYMYCNESIWDRPPCDFLKPLIMHGVYNYAQIWIHYHVKVLTVVSGICKHSTRNRKKLNIPVYCFSYEDYVAFQEAIKIAKQLRDARNKEKGKNRK